MRLRRTTRRLFRNAGCSRRVTLSFAEIISANHCDIAIDVGANDGGFGREIRDSGYNGCMHSFEPNPSAFRRLSLNIKDDPLWEAVPYGVGHSSGNLRLNVSSDDVSSSFKELNDFGQTPNSRVVEQETVEVIRLDDYFEQNPRLLKRPYLKIDTQGFEREVLEGLGDKFDRMVAIQVETSLIDSYIGQSDWLDSLIFMRDRGFEVATMICNSAGSDTVRAREYDIVFLHSTA